MRSLCIIELHNTVNNIKKYLVLHNNALWHNYAVGKNNSRWRLYVRRSILFSDVNQIYNRSEDFHRSAQCKILGKSVHWQPRWYMQSEGRTWRNSLALFATMRMRLQTHFSNGKDKGKAIPLQVWTGPEDSRRLRLPDFMTIGTWKW